ncbi:hypothetical protein Hamer_G020650 [Homarus americanus]|uniref:Secreted protein n=1 Tax=Homarus americanus TaxID=6706 RepID=A0A8J5KAK1_HOMAM|nr:hypothetical protein Hamer_G020650 [Homarus americanus]
MVSMKLFTTTSTLVILVVLGLSLEMVTAEDCDLPTCTVISGQEVRCKNPYAWFEFHPHPANPNQYVQCTRIRTKHLVDMMMIAWKKSSNNNKAARGNDKNNKQQQKQEPQESEKRQEQ